MIDELQIHDLGVINQATIALHPGLTVVTGETGAGKTMIVTGLGLLLGERADARTVRSGADRARVQGIFRIDDPAIVEQVIGAGGELEDDELIVARHLTAAGRSRAYVGGAQVPAPVCAAITDQLIAIHGQSEQQRLATADRPRQLLDRFAGAGLSPVLQRFGDRYADRRTAATELGRLRSEALARAREIDLLRFGLEEIERVAPRAGEDLALAAEAQRLQSADDLRHGAQTALLAIAGADDEAGGALSEVSTARKVLDHGPADAELGDLGRRLAETSYLLADVAADLARYLDTLDAQPGRLEAIAERRSALAGLTRKYGTTVDEVIAWSADSAARLVTLQSSDDRIEILSTQVDALDAQLVELATTITAARTAAAGTFADLVVAELAALAMPHARLIFQVSPVELGPHGADQVELLFSANPGSEPRSLGKVASGGELSRVRLALEVVLAADREAGTLVFDEVDAGVGGRVAVEIGRRLARLAQVSQVVVVTHLAQVAAFADRHYVVIKADDGQVTTSGVQLVSDAERAAELARMMAGLETTESALAHAGELVELAAAPLGPRDESGPVRHQYRPDPGGRVERSGGRRVVGDRGAAPAVRSAARWRALLGRRDPGQRRCRTVAGRPRSGRRRDQQHRLLPGLPSRGRADLDRAADPSRPLPAGLAGRNAQRRGSTRCCGSGPLAEPHRLTAGRMGRDENPDAAAATFHPHRDRWRGAGRPTDEESHQAPAGR